MSLMMQDQTLSSNYSKVTTHVPYNTSATAAVATGGGGGYSMTDPVYDVRKVAGTPLTDSDSSSSKKEELTEPPVRKILPAPVVNNEYAREGNSNGRFVYNAIQSQGSETTSPTTISSPHSSGTLATANPPMHYRTNFGKSRGYMPPVTYDSPPRLVTPPSRQSTWWVEDDVPFDQSPENQNPPCLVAENRFESRDIFIRSDRHAIDGERSFLDRSSLARERLGARVQRLKAYYNAKNGVPEAQGNNTAVQRHNEHEHDRSPLRINESVSVSRTEAHSGTMVGNFPERSHVGLHPPTSHHDRFSMSMSDNYVEPDQLPVIRSGIYQESLSTNIPDSLREPRSLAANGSGNYQEQDYQEPSLISADRTASYHEPYSPSVNRSHQEQISSSMNMSGSYKEASQDVNNSNEYEEFGLSPGSPSTIAEEVHRPPDDDSKVDDGFGVGSSSVEPGTPRKSALKKNGKHSRRSRRASNDDTDDDTSLENDYGVTYPKPDDGLQERAQQAFSSRNKSQLSASRPHATKVTSRAIVTFDDRPVTIQYFEQEEDSVTNTTLSDQRSLGSDYTKSMESEIEDVIKDLFFVGDGKGNHPGRRSLKYRSQSNLSSTCGADVADEDSTLFLEDGPSRDDNVQKVSDEDDHEKSVSRETDESSKQRMGLEFGTHSKSRVHSYVSADEDPISMVWGIFEGGVSAMSDAIGLSGAAGSCGIPELQGGSCQNASEEKAMREEMAALIVSSGLSFETSSIKSLQKSRSKEMDSEKENAINSYYHAGVQKSSVPKSRISRGISRGSTLRRDMNFPSCFPEKQKRRGRGLENDPHLAELALFTTRLIHRLSGCVYDEKTNIVMQVKFQVVKIGLPLGILFQENEGGCWVAKVFPSGNAALNFNGDRVEIGDQLAEVDGTSTVRMKVDDICSLFSEASNPNEIELTFLRYVGPLHPKQNPTSGDGQPNELPSVNEEHQDTKAQKRGLNQKKDVNKKERRFGWFGRQKSASK